jgi:hypothetical protein
MKSSTTAVSSQDQTKVRSKGKIALLKSLSVAIIVATVSSGFPLAPAQASATYDGTDGTVLCTTGYFTVVSNEVTGHTECGGAVVIPAGVTSIGSGGFAGSSITSVVFSGTNTLTTIGVSAFQSIQSLTSIEIPSSVTTIDPDAFAYSNALTSITVIEPNVNYSSVGGVLFNNDQSSLVAYANGIPATTYSIPAGVTSIAVSAFRGANLTSVTIPASVTTIGDSAFGGSQVSSVIFSGTSTLTTIGGYAFQSAQITSITIPASVTTIGDSAFGSAMNLASVVFSGTSTLATIGADAFSSTSLTSFTIPASVTTIGANAFLSYNLVSISVPADNQNYSSLDGVLFNKQKTSLINFPASKLATTYSIPTSVTRIEASAFSQTSALASVTIPSSVTTIGDRAFHSAVALTSITVAADNENYSSLDGVLFDKQKTSVVNYPMSNLTKTYSIPSSVTSVEAFAFYGAPFYAVTIPSSTSVIRNNAFMYARSNLNVYFLGDAPTVGSDAFMGVDGKAYIKTGATGFTAVGTAWKGLTVADLDDGVRSCTTGTYTIQDFVVTNGYSCAGAAVIADGVQAIHTEAFTSNEILTSVAIPASVMSIGTNSFASTSTLTSFSVDPANPNFSSEGGVLFNKNKSSLLLFPAARGNTPYVVPASVVTIGAGAFQSNRSLASITIPENVESIGNFAFFDADKLTSVVFSGTSRLASIGRLSFKQSKLESINIPASVTVIGAEAFMLAPLSSVTFDESSPITTIASSTFQGVSTLISIRVPASVTSIQEYAFYEASQLANVVFLGNAPTVGVEAFTDVAAGAKATISASATGFPAAGSAWNGLTVEIDAPPAAAPPAEVAPVVTTPAVVAPVVTTPPVVAPVVTTPPAAAIVSTTPAVSAVGTSVSISRKPSAAIATAVAIGVSKTKVMVALKVPKASKPANQVTKYVIQLKSAKGAIITKTISVKAGRTFKPTLTGKKKTTYSMTVTAVTKSGKKTTWKGPKVKTS